ncbi:hypothetical protein M0811_10259 [Anaeramoeba ignava]|uniref:Uncharacterized protein n=1 Tax=Anaeramoeba ignava TaxID=1746090 RepID=A0A9Q0LEU9_ANAIG|nr:hypothetical protein M0811_10259 [Anaeramoeba ignava]
MKTFFVKNIPVIKRRGNTCKFITAIFAYAISIILLVISQGAYIENHFDHLIEIVIFCSIFFIFSVYLIQKMVITRIKKIIIYLFLSVNLLITVSFFRGDKNTNLTRSHTAILFAFISVCVLILVVIIYAAYKLKLIEKIKKHKKPVIIFSVIFLTVFYLYLLNEIDKAKKDMHQGIFGYGISNEEDCKIKEVTPWIALFPDRFFNFFTGSQTCPSQKQFSKLENGILTYTSCDKCKDSPNSCYFIKNPNFMHLHMHKNLKNDHNYFVSGESKYTLNNDKIYYKGPVDVSDAEVIDAFCGKDENYYLQHAIDKATFERAKSQIKKRVELYKNNLKELENFDKFENDETINDKFKKDETFDKFEKDLIDDKFEKDETFDKFRKINENQKINEDDENQKIDENDRFDYEAYPINIEVLMIDCISRCHIRRKMPKLLETLKKIDEESDFSVFEFFRYFSVGRNTRFNLLPMFTGTNDMEAIPGKLFWNDFIEDKGYITSWIPGECEFMLKFFWGANVSTTNLDHVVIPAFCHPDYEPGYHTNFIGPHSLRRRCIGSKLVSSYVFDYVEQFMFNPIYEKEHIGRFAYSILMDAHESSAENVMTVDEGVSNHLLKFSQKASKNSVLIFFSDHGSHMGHYYEYDGGRLENRLPFLFILVSKDLLEKYPQIKHSLKSNENPILTVYDLYATFRHLSTFPFNQVSDENRFSLLEPLPHRDCSQANIPFEYRTCPCEDEFYRNDLDQQ